MSIRCLSGIALAAWAAVPLTAQVKKVDVHCVDLDGKPVAGAEVVVFMTQPISPTESRMKQYGPYTCGGDGRVTTVPAITRNGGKFWRMAYARLPGKLIGSVVVADWTGSKPEDPIQVVMQPSRDVRGHVTAPDGFEPTSITVRVLTVMGTVGDNQWAMTFPRSYSLSRLRDCLPELFDVRVAKDGSFVLRDLPTKGRLYLAAEGKGLGQAQWNLIPKFGDPVPPIPERMKMELHPESSVSGIVRGPDDRPAAGIEVIVQSLDQGVRTSFAATTDAQGRYRVAGLANGQHRVTVKPDNGVMRPFDADLVRGKETTEQHIRIENGVVVSGRVVDGNGKPVEGVNLSAIDPNPFGSRIGLGSGSTDPQGRFELTLPIGPAELYFSGVPKGFAYPNPPIVAEIEVAADDKNLRKLELKLQRTK